MRRKDTENLRKVLGAKFIARKRLEIREAIQDHLNEASQLYSTFVIKGEQTRNGKIAYAQKAFDLFFQVEKLDKTSPYNELPESFFRQKKRAFKLLLNDIPAKSLDFFLKNIERTLEVLTNHPVNIHSKPSVLEAKKIVSTGILFEKILSRICQRSQQTEYGQNWIAFHANFKGQLLNFKQRLGFLNKPELYDLWSNQGPLTKTDQSHGRRLEKN